MCQSLLAKKEELSIQYQTGKRSQKYFYMTTRGIINTGVTETMSVLFEFIFTTEVVWGF